MLGANRRSRASLNPRGALLCLLALLLATPAHAQEEDRHRGTFWLGAMGSLRFDPSWSLWFDTHYNHQAFFVLRLGMTHHFDAGPSVTAGYAHLFTNPGDGSLRRSEHRPWAQVVFPVRLSDEWSFSQRVRYDLRLRQALDAGAVVDGWLVTNRLRSQSVLTYWFPRMPFGRFLVQLADEILVHFGPDAGPNHLDQNRLSALLGLRAEPVTVRIGYMYRFLPGVRGLAPRHEHAALLWVNYALSLLEPEAEALPERSNP